MNINKAMLTGNITQTPTLKNTANDTHVLSFSLASNTRRRKASEDEWEDVPMYIDCTVFGNRAKALADILKKGTKVAISGRISYSSWETDGQKHSKHEIIVEELDILKQKSEQ